MERLSLLELRTPGLDLWYCYVHYCVCMFTLPSSQLDQKPENDNRQVKSKLIAIFG